MLRWLFIVLFFTPIYNWSQIEGQVISLETGIGIENAIIFIDDLKETTTSKDGKFTFFRTAFPCTLRVEKEAFVTRTFIINDNKPIKISLEANVRTIDAVVVSAGRREQKVEEISISVEILKPELINNKGITDLEQAVNQSPGVYAMDGQVSIR